MRTIFLLFLGIFFNSTLFSQVTFDNGETYYTDSTETVLCNGKFRKFYSGFNIKSSATYSNGKLHGEYVEHYTNGLIKSTMHYSNGLLNGEVVEYYPEINIMKTKFHYTNGLKNGECTTYDEVGEVILKQIYVNGVLQP